jgi:hypothetical protein
VLQVEIAHVQIEEFPAVIAEANYEPHDGVSADTRNPLGRTNRIPFNHQFQNGKLLVPLE